MAPRIIERDHHPISRKNIDGCALKVLYRLYRSGHTAYLVGGGVRDLFLKRQPKDFDVVTSARPSQVKRLFRNCRLIGRRFRLAHVHFGGDKLVEVATFRSDPGGGDDDSGDDLLVRYDNTFGTPEEDARRRDFTINGLFYDVSDFTVIDWVGGAKDIERRIVRTIGDPWTRFQEDPIRMTRAVKFASRLGFRVETKTWKAMLECAEAIQKSPKPRTFEEFARLLEEGSAERALELLDESGLLDHLEPNMARYFTELENNKKPEDPDGGLIYSLLHEADRLHSLGTPLSRPVLFACWLIPLLLDGGFLTSSNPDRLVRDQATKVLAPLGLSRRETERVQQILLAQRRLRPRGNRRRRSAPKTLLQKSYFKESFQVFELFVRATGHWEEELEWWREHLQLSEVESADHGEAKKKKVNRRRVRRRRTT